MEEEKKPAAPASATVGAASSSTVGAPASSTVGAPAATVDAPVATVDAPAATDADAAGAGSAATEGSIFDEIFGPMVDASKPDDSTSSAGYFSTLFPTPAEAAAAARRRGQCVPGNKWAGQQQQGYDLESSPYFSSSGVHYGGRDYYIPDNNSSTTKKKTDEGDNSGAANRGDWWQGSLYY